MTNLHPYYFQHIEHGYIVTYDEMMNILKEEYDLDETNLLDWREYFFETFLRVDELEIVEMDCD